MEPFEITECSPATGEPCGALFLDRGFEKLVCERLGIGADSLQNPQRRTLTHALSWFETVKLNFNPFDGESDESYDVPVPWLVDVRGTGIEDGYLLLSR